MSQPARFGQAVRAQATMEARLTARRGENLLAMVGLPAAALLFFGLVATPARTGCDGPAAGVLALAIVASGLVNLGIATAYERGYGVLKRLGGSPLGRDGSAGREAGRGRLHRRCAGRGAPRLAWVVLGWRPGPDGSVIGLVVAVGMTTLVGAAAFAGLGLLIAGTLRPEAALVLANALFLVALMVGGVLVPVAGPAGAPGVDRRSAAGRCSRRSVPRRARVWWEPRDQPRDRRRVGRGGPGRRRTDLPLGVILPMTGVDRVVERLNLSLDADAIPCRARPPWPCRHPRRPWTSEDSSNERGGAIMTPSPRSLDARLARLDAAARLILRDSELARDAVQEALIRAWRDLPGLRDPDRFDAWLHRLLVNACLDLVRRRKRRVIEVELTPIDAPSTRDFAAALADRELARSRRSRRLDDRASRGRRPALLPGDAAARGGGDPGHPARDGQVTAALRASPRCASP